MIPFRPKATDGPDYSNRSNNVTEPQKPPTEYNSLLSATHLTSNPNVSEENAQNSLSVIAPNESTAEQLRPLATYKPPPVPPSDAAPSSGGRSLSCPTEHEADGPYKLPSSRIIADDFPPSLFDHDAYDDSIRLEPLELELPPNAGDIVEPSPGPLPWKFEFSWSSELLTFNGEQLSVSFFPGSPSEASGAVVGGSSLASATGFTVQESVVSTGNTDPDSLAKACFREGEIRNAVLERRDHLIDLLEDHYWRTHPPQRTSKRNSAARHSGVDMENRKSSSVRTATSGNSGKPSPPRKGRGITGGEGDGDDDDEQEDDDGKHGSRQAKLKTMKRFFACPYLKWKPQKYDKCTQHFRNIAYMIDHLEEKHFPQRCPTCGIAYNTPTEMKHHRKNHCYGSFYADPHSIDPNELTAEKLTQIRNRRKYKANDPENQWHNIYKILFPDSPPPRSVYREGNAINEFADGLLSFIGAEAGNVLARFQDELSREDPFAHSFETRAEQSKAVLDGFFTRLMAHAVSEYMADGSRVPGTGQANDSSQQSGGQPKTLSSPPHDSPNTRATKGKSVRFGRPTTYAFSTLSALTEEESPENATPGTSEPSAHIVDSSGREPFSTPSDETKPSVAHKTDDHLVQLAVGGEPINASDQKAPVPTGRQQVDPHDLYFPLVGAWSDFTMTPAIQSSNSLDLDLGWDGGVVDCPNTTNQYILPGSEPSTLDLNGDFISAHATPGDLQAEDLLSGLSGSFWEEKSLDPSMSSNSVYNKFPPPVPWSPSTIFDLNNFPDQ